MDRRPSASTSVSFNRIAKQYDQTRGGEARGRAVAAILTEHLVPGLVLEVGVGTGVVAAGLREFGYPACGVDIAADMLVQAAERMPGLVSRGDATRLPFATNTVHNVVCAHVLHLVANMDEAIAEAARVLRSGGRLVVLHGDAFADPDHDVTLAMDPLAPLRERQDSFEALATSSETAGLRVVTQHAVGPNERGFSPRDFADGMMKRQYPYLWGVDDQTWARLVRPVIDGLLALPDPDRERPLAWWSPLSVFGKD
ncbi:MAG: methyltransferase domain-containing protein [Umezawaea sp.]